MPNGPKQQACVMLIKCNEFDRGMKDYTMFARSQVNIPQQHNRTPQKYLTAGDGLGVVSLLLISWNYSQISRRKRKHKTFLFD